MVKLFKFILFYVFSMCPLIAVGDIHVTSSVGFLQDQKSLTSRDLIQTSFYDFGVYLQAVRNYQFYLGFEYIYISTSQPNTTATNTASLISSNAMVALKYFFGRRKLFSVSVMGSPVIQANYKITGSATDLWTGSAFATKFSILPELSSSLKLSASVIYYSAIYTSKNSSGSSTTVSSFSRNLLVPTLGLQYDF
jgi:hypothetical protein